MSQYPYGTPHGHSGVAEDSFVGSYAPAQQPPSQPGQPSSTGSPAVDASGGTVTSSPSQFGDRLPISPDDRSPGSSEGQPVGGDANKSRDQTVPSACLGCRSKHLKCDGQKPCSRCVASDLECIYVASRRGYKGPRRGTASNPNKRQATSPARTESMTANDCTVFGVTSSSGQMPAALLKNPGADLYGTANNGLTYKVPNDQHGGAVAHYDGYAVAKPGPRTLEERCMEAFFRFFHGSHPFVLPKEHLLQISKDVPMEPLLAAIRWVGSLYIPIEEESRRERMQAEALRLASDPHQTQDAFLLQAKMVLIIGLDGNTQNEKARELLGDAERTVLQLGMNSRSFATLNGQGMPVMEESWRRTWWDLFVIDGMIAGVHRATNFLLFDVPADVSLPCEEHQYLSGNIPQPQQLEDLEDREFSGDDREYSSFAYRILCARNLGKLMRMPPIRGPEDENLARIEALLTNWRLHLPESKKDMLDREGKLDEMMFQANMMVNATSIMLHQPHSQMDSSPTQTVNSCAPHRLVPFGDNFNAHTRHTLSSASEISKLITHRVPLLSHTHFFTCVVTLSSIVHLNHWALLSAMPHVVDDDLRQEIRLNIGALNSLSQVWGAADRARGQVKGVAQEIYAAKKQLRMSPQFWVGYSQEEVNTSLATDDSIFSEIHALEGVPLLQGLIE